MSDDAPTPTDVQPPAGAGSVSAPQPQPPETPPITGESINALYAGTKIPQSTLDNLVSMAHEHGMGYGALKAVVQFDLTQKQAAEQASRANWDQLQKQWIDELKQDSELSGGDGFEKNISRLQQVVHSYGGPAKEDGFNELQQLLNSTGIGNHPVFARFAARIAKHLPGEGQPVGGNPAPGPGDTINDVALRMFPSMRT